MGCDPGLGTELVSSVCALLPQSAHCFLVEINNWMVSAHVFLGNGRKVSCKRVVFLWGNHGDNLL